MHFREFKDFKAFSYLRLYNLPDRMGVPVGSSICIKLWRHTGGKLLITCFTMTISILVWSYEVLLLQLFTVVMISFSRTGLKNKLQKFILFRHIIMKWSILIWHGDFVSKIHTYINKILLEFIHCNIFITYTFAIVIKWLWIGRWLLWFLNEWI